MKENKILKAYSIRIYPNKEQEQQILNNFGACRWLYNQMLDMQIKRYENGGKFVNEFGMNYLLPLLKKEYPWLKQADASSLQIVNRDISEAFKQFFNHKKNFPRFKSRKFPKQSYTSKYTDVIKVIDNHHLKLPKLGHVYYRSGRQIEGKIKRATVRLSSTGKYYVSVLVEQSMPKPFVRTKQEVGIDRNVDNLCALSNGEIIPTIRFDKNLAKKKLNWQRKLARRRLRAMKEIAWDKHNKVLEPRTLEDFSNYKKAKHMVALYAEKERNQRKDYLQKLSTKLVKQFDKIVLEDLRTSNMLRNHKLARAISNQGWYLLETMLSYKCAWYGKELIKVPARNTTQRCSSCGFVLPKEQRLTLKDREWTCPNCNEHHIRDVNAALNILQAA